MDFLFNLQLFVWLGLLGYLIYMSQVKGQSWDDLMNKKAINCLALTYMVIGIPTWMILNPFFSSISENSVSSSDLYTYTNDAQGFSWAGGGFVLIWNIVTLAIAAGVTSYIHGNKPSDN